MRFVLWVYLLQVAEMNATIDSHLDLQPGRANIHNQTYRHLLFVTIADNTGTNQASGEAG